jgi:hypothetical protein
MKLERTLSVIGSGDRSVWRLVGDRAGRQRHAGQPGGQRLDGLRRRQRQSAGAGRRSRRGRRPHGADRLDLPQHGPRPSTGCVPGPGQRRRRQLPRRAGSGRLQAARQRAGDHADGVRTDRRATPIRCRSGRCPTTTATASCRTGRSRSAARRRPACRRRPTPTTSTGTWVQSTMSFTATSTSQALTFVATIPAGIGARDAEPRRRGAEGGVLRARAVELGAAAGRSRRRAGHRASAPLALTRLPSVSALLHQWAALARRSRSACWASSAGSRRWRLLFGVLERLRPARSAALPAARPGRRPGVLLPERRRAGVRRRRRDRRGQLARGRLGADRLHGPWRTCRWACAWRC